MILIQLLNKEINNQDKIGVLLYEMVKHKMTFRVSPSVRMSVRDVDFGMLELIYRVQTFRDYSYSS